MTWPATSFCAFTDPRGAVCGEPVTQGVLNPDRWFHTARMFDFILVRSPEKHPAVPMLDETQVAAARRKWRGIG